MTRGFPKYWRIAHRSALGLAALVLQGCDLPRDAGGTLERVRGSYLRVGMVASEAHVDAGSVTLVGQDRAMIEGFAGSLNAAVQWRRGAAETLYRALEVRDLDVVVGGVDCDSPWSKRIALSRKVGTFPGPAKAHRCFATPPGENGFLLALNRFIVAANVSERP